MNVLVIGNCAYGLLAFRGKLAEKLVEQKNTVITIIPLSTDADELSAKMQLENIGCRCICVPMDRRGINPVSDIKLYKNIRTILKQEKPDLVITYTIKPNVYGGMACRLLKIPYAMNITGLGTAFENDGIVKTIACCLYRTASLKAKVVFFENSEDKHTMLRLGLVKESQCIVLSGAGVDLEKYSVLPYPADETTRFLFIGRVMREKGVEELFEAMKMLIDDGIPATLDVLGGYEEDYHEAIALYEEEGWLKYHGYQSDVRPFIVGCHCFVLPSWHEGMANTNLECAASGRPVITSNIAGCREAVIENESGLLCEPKNAESLYERMKQFCAMPAEKRIQFGLRGRQHMEEVFDKQKVVAETIRALGL